MVAKQTPELRLLKKTWSLMGTTAHEVQFAGVDRLVCRISAPWAGSSHRRGMPAESTRRGARLRVGCLTAV